MPTLEDYGHADDWQYIDNVLTAKLRFGKDRILPAGIDRELISGVKILICNPDSKLVVVGASESMLASDRVITIWSSTVLQGTTRVTVEEGDILCVDSGVDEQRYLVASLLETMWDTQYRCYCKRLAFSGF